MKSDLTCPVEVTGARMNGQQEGEALCCMIDFRNLSEKTVDSLQMNIICYDADGARLGGRLIRAAAHGEPLSMFSGAFYPERMEGAVRVDASVEKVWFQDGVIWRREERNVREYRPNALPPGRELDRLRAVAGQDAMGYPREDDNVWMCVCGRANRTSDERCMRCRRERTQVLHDYSFAAIDLSVGRREREMEEKTRESLQKSSRESASLMEEERREKKKRQRRLRAVVSLLLVVAAALAAWRWGVPYGAVMYADKTLAAGQAADAKEIFLWVDGIWPGFMEADSRAKAAEYTIIERLIAAGTEDSLAEAAQRAKAMEGETAQAFYRQALIEDALRLEKAGEIQKAEERLAPIADTQEGRETLGGISYRAAVNAMERTDYAEAIGRFEALADYEDAADLLPECHELYGYQLMREKKYEQAIGQLLLVADRRGVMDAVRQSTYALAGEKMEADALLEAAMQYESLGVYEEAVERAAFCRYTLGMEQMEAGDLETASENLALAGDYEDARKMLSETNRTIGFAALEKGDYRKALAYLEETERDEEVEKALSVAGYGQAQALEASGAFDEAALAYAALGEYEDAPERALAMQYAAAEALMQSDIGEALERFDALGAYKDSVKRVSECRSKLASRAFDAKEYDKALACYEAMGAEGAMGAKSCRYALGAQEEADGEYARAAELFAACGAYRDAEERAAKSAYASAEALEAEENFAGAIAAFRALGSWEDAPRRAAACEDKWLQSAFNSARMDMELGDYAAVIAELTPFADMQLPERYKDMSGMLTEANEKRALALIAQGKPLDALPYLETAAERGSKTAKSQLDAYVYGIIGRWKTQRGMEFVFRRDGTCAIDGKEGYFGGSKYDLYIGDKPYPTEKAYAVVALRGKGLTLTDAKDGKTLRLTYLGEPTPPKAEEEAAQAEESASETDDADHEEQEKAE